uniref:Uncharacterized protein n=1 Tax=viral metagenome TaxID=1070528 RepID=A0A6C0KHW8_9ZZZZ
MAALLNKSDGLSLIVNGAQDLVTPQTEQILNRSGLGLEHADNQGNLVSMTGRGLDKTGNQFRNEMNSLLGRIDPDHRELMIQVINFIRSPTVVTVGTSNSLQWEEGGKTYSVNKSASIAKLKARAQQMPTVLQFGKKSKKSSKKSRSKRSQKNKKRSIRSKRSPKKSARKPRRSDRK